MLQIDEMDPSQSINDLFQPLYQRASNIYTFVALRNQADEISRDYGTGELSNMPEAHLVIDICDHEGATVTELAEMSCRTKSAISQIIAKIEKKGYITRKRCKSNYRVYHFYPTEEGLRLCRQHKIYDVQMMLATNERLLKFCTQEEIDAFYKVLHYRCIDLKERLDTDRKASMEKEKAAK